MGSVRHTRLRSSPPATGGRWHGGHRCAPRSPLVFAIVGAILVALPTVLFWQLPPPVGIHAAAASAASPSLGLAGAANPRLVGQARTLATTRSRIIDFAQDGGHNAWIEQARVPLGDCRTTVRIRRLRPLRETPVRLLHSTCDFSHLALGGPRAVWVLFYGGAGQHYWKIETAGLGSRRSAYVEELVQSTSGRGDVLSDTAADGDVLVYGVVEWRQRDGDCDFEPACELILGPGRVQGRFAIPMLPPPALLAVHGDRIAVVEAGEGSPGKVHPTGTVEIRTLDGSPLTRVSASGKVAAIALARQFVALIAQQGRRKQLEIYDLQTARLVAATVLSAPTAPEIGISGSTVVFRTGRRIHVFDLLTRTRRQVATATSAPIGLSIEGRRIAWAENLRTRGRIRALLLRNAS